jgi:hypothetical protein
MTMQITGLPGYQRREIKQNSEFYAEAAFDPFRY